MCRFHHLHLRAFSRFSFSPLAVMKRFRLSSDANSFRGRNAERGRKTWPEVSCAQELNFLDFPELLLHRRIDGVVVRLVSVEAGKLSPSSW